VLQAIKGCQAELALLHDRSASAWEALLLLLPLKALKRLCLLLLSMQALRSSQACAASTVSQALAHDA
jgi:hypothetical protein